MQPEASVFRAAGARKDPHLAAGASPFLRCPGPPALSRASWCAGEGERLFDHTGWAGATRGWAESPSVVALRSALVKANGIQAQRAQVKPVGDRDHRVRTGVMRPIKGRGLGRVEAATHGVLRVVKPNAHVKGVGGWKRYTGIEAEDLVHKFAHDGNKGLSIGVHLDVGLIPRKPKSRWVLESRVEGAIRIKVGTLYGE